MNKICNKKVKALKFIPWSEQKNPCRHLEQDSFEDVPSPDIGACEAAGTVALGLVSAFFNTGFSVVCLPVLHLH